MFPTKKYRMGSGQQIKESMEWLWKVSKGYRTRILCVGAMGVARVTISLTFIWVCKRIIDNVTGEADGGLNGLIAEMIGLMLSRLLLSLASERISRKAEAGLTNRIRLDIFTHLMTSRWSGKEERHSGDIVNRVIDDVPNVAAMICGGIPSTMVTVFQLLGALYLLSMMDARLALALLLITPTALLLSKSYLRKIRRLTQEIRSAESSVQEHFQESVQNNLLLRSLEFTPNSVTKLRNLQTTLLGKVMGYTDFALFSRAMVQLGFSAGYITAFLWGIFGLKSGAVTFGTMTAFLQLAAQIQNPIVQLSRQIPAFARVLTSAGRLSELTSAPGEEPESPVAQEGLTGIRIEGLGFAYSENEKRIFSDLSYDFVPGSLTAVIGKTGIGKTTLMRLLLALVSPCDGKIVFYNNEGKEYPASPSTRRNLSYVPQGNTLFSGTVRDNLLMGKPDATENELIEALHTAAADFVTELPDGLDTKCGEKGLGFSEGQAQRIAIARGLLRPGGILLLDEPSSSLDIETEKILIQRLKEKAKGKTLILVTHREEIASICTSVLRIDTPA